MKNFIPDIISFENLYKEYSKIKVYDPGEYFVLSDDKKRLDVSDPSFKNSSLGMGEERRKNVLNVLEKNKETLSEIEDAMLEFVQFQIMLNPRVYIARTKDIKTEIEYFTAKTFYPIKGGKKKEVKIYLGKAIQYGNNTKSLKAKSDARIKMTQTLARRMREGSL